VYPAAEQIAHKRLLQNRVGGVHESIELLAAPPQLEVQRRAKSSGNPLDRCQCHPA
jgi:hypothetical protein